MVSESKNLQSLIYNNSSDLIALLRVEKNERFVMESMNDTLRNLFEFTGIIGEGESLIGKDLECLFTELLKFGEKEKEVRLNKYKNCSRNKEMVSFEIQTQTPNEENTIYHLTRLIPILNEKGDCERILVTIRDNTSYANALKILKEKNALLKESHHRMKNNLQVVSSLLTLQSHSIKDEEIKNKFQQSKDRIQAIALVHEKIYKSQTLSELKAKSYVEGIIEQLKRSFDSDNRVEIRTNIGDFLLDPEMALPCGLIINEAVSNSFKHAFKDGQGGKIWLSMKKDEEKFELLIRDSGNKSVSKDMSTLRETQSLGLELIHTFAEQLKGKLELNKEKGFSVKVTVN